MLDPHLISIAGRVSADKDGLLWLREYQPSAERVVDFGCNTGNETLALAWALGATEAVGVDINEFAVVQAKDTLESVHQAVILFQRYLTYYPDLIDIEDRRKWEQSVSDFFRTLPTLPHIRYVVDDIRSCKKLETEYFDIAYCDHVLYNLWFNVAMRGRREQVTLAIAEMARVTKQQGVIVICEPLEWSDEEPFDLASILKEIGLAIQAERIDKSEHSRLGTYICKKSTSLLENHG